MVMDEQEKGESMFQSNLGRKSSKVSRSDLTIHESHLNNTVIKKMSCAPKDEKRNGVDFDGSVVRYTTSSSNDLSLTFDKTHANCLPPDYCVSSHYILIDFILLIQTLFYEF